jgi:hypothetical protein
VIDHGGEHNPARYAQLGEHVPQAGVFTVRGEMGRRLATAPFVTPPATSSDTARSIAVTLSQPPACL